MSEILLNRALVELKTLDARILAATKPTTLFVSLTKGRKEPKPILAQFKDAAEVAAAIKSNHQSLDDLIKRRSAIKFAIAEANVKTKVTINGKEMSIVEAIDMKNVVAYKQSLVAVLKLQLAQAANNMERSRLEIETNVQGSIDRLLGTDVKNKSAVEQNQALITSTKDAIMDMHELNMIDPLDVKTLIKTLEDEIAAVTDEIDYALSAVNATTHIKLAL
jgi:hypothetical protein